MGICERGDELFFRRGASATGGSHHHLRLDAAPFQLNRDDEAEQLLGARGDAGIPTRLMSMRIESA
jgi:hypothetical protein